MFLKFIITLAAIPLLAVFFGTSKAKAEGDPEGLALFKKYKCQQCHSIQALGLEVVEDDSEKDEEEADGEEKKDPSDLSGAGIERDADWLQKWLKKSVKKDKKLHRKKFKGSKDELKTLASWLETLKTKVEKKK